MNNESCVASDEVCVRELYDRIIDGFNHQDGNGFASSFTDDADFVVFDGTVLKGRHQIATVHQKLFDEFLMNTRLVAKVRDVRFITKDVALLHAVNGTVTVGKWKIEPERNSIQTVVAQRFGEKWHIVAFHNSRASFPADLEASTKLTTELQRLLETQILRLTDSRSL